jgi:hypothetical protein
MVFTPVATVFISLHLVRREISPYSPMFSWTIGKATTVTTLPAGTDGGT